jgi:sugar-specific transcriptional regulator TrmB/DNA-binding CsgD family transcriptional regulator
VEGHVLSDLGFTAVSERVYRAMLDDPALTAAGIAERLGLPPSDVRAALDQLADLALIRREGGEHAQVVRPGVGLTALLNKIELEVAAKQRRIEATRETIASIAALHQFGDRIEETRRIEGLHAIRDRLAELALDARLECLSFTTGGAQRPDTIAAEKPLNQRALERGVAIRNVYQESFRNDPATLAYARWMASLGASSRTVPTLPMRLVIVDRVTALVPVDPEAPADAVHEVRSPGIIAGLLALFEQVWDSGTAFGEQPAPNDAGLAPQETVLIRLLAAGQTDEAAARRLAVSVRSVQRMTSTIMDRLTATSRFQAGVEAARRGWV